MESISFSTLGVPKIGLPFWNQPLMRVDIKNVHIICLFHSFSCCNFHTCKSGLTKLPRNYNWAWVSYSRLRTPYVYINDACLICRGTSIEHNRTIGLLKWLLQSADYKWNKESQQLSLRKHQTKEWLPGIFLWTTAGQYRLNKFFLNWGSFQGRLISHYNTWSYNKKKRKKMQEICLEKNVQLKDVS